MGSGQPPATPIILASASAGRQAMLRAAGVDFAVMASTIDEGARIAALQQAGSTPRDMADALAEAKAVQVSGKCASHKPGALVIGADQILCSADGALYQKPATPDDARHHLRALSGTTHSLYSAAVIAQDGRPIWRAVSRARMTMRTLSPSFVDAYVAAHWDRIQWTVGCYEVEGAGAALFTKIDGDPYTIIGLPLLDLLGYLRERGVLAT